MRYLIINADDFGGCLATNQAIENIFNNDGPLSSTTIMASFPGAKDALNRVKSNPKIRIGLHITTVSDSCAQPLLSPEKVPSLVDDQGNFYTTVEEFYKHALANEVIEEMEAQYKYIVNSGVFLSHADSHMGSLYGTFDATFIKETLDFCARYGLAFRYPRNINSLSNFIPMKPLPLPLIAGHEQAVAYADSLGVGLIDYMITQAQSHKIITSYEKLKNAYQNIIADLSEGVSEVFMHPSLISSPNAKNNPNWCLRVWEYKLLMDDDFKKHLEKEEIALTTYQDAPFTVVNMGAK